MTEQAILNKISKGATLLLIGMVISKVFSYIYRVIIARYLGADVYGLFSIGLAVIGILVSLSLVGLPQGILRYVSYYSGKRDEKSIHAIINNAFKIIIPLSLLFTLLLFIFAKWISLYFFHDPSLVNMLKLMSFAIPLTVIAIGIEYSFQAFQKINYIVIAKTIVGPVSKVTISLIVLIMGYKLMGIAFAYIFSLFISALLMAYFLKKIVSFRKIALAPPIFYKQLLYFSLPLMFSELFISLLTWSDTLILGYFVPAVQVGIYNAAVPTAYLIFTIPVALITLFMPTISGMYARKEDFSNLYDTINKWMFLVGVPSVLVLGLYSKQILSILFGKIFVEGYFVLILIAISFFIYSLMLTSESILIIMKKTKLILFNSFLTVLLNIIMNLLLIPKYGLMGAAIATASAFLLTSILVAIETYYLTKLFPLKLGYIKCIISAAIPFTLIVYLNTYINTHVLFGLIFLALIYLVLYIILLRLTHALGAEEISLIKSAWQKVKTKF
ncbi:MAG: flippase [Candidatus Nanoarchaeia archaeon]|jgi:O-antigen/teichoic acid export membrane protein